MSDETNLDDEITQARQRAKRVERLTTQLVSALFGAAILAFLLAIWTGDGRFGGTGGVLIAVTIVSGLIGLCVWESTEREISHLINQGNRRPR